MRRILLLGLLALVAVAAVTFFALREGEGDVVPTHTASDELIREFAAIQTAEKISDPYDRCMAYPDPPEFKWDRKIVDAYCALGLRKAISTQELRAELQQGHTASLKNTFDSYVSKNYEPGQHGFLIWVFRELFDYDHGAELAGEWVKADPESSYALAGRGVGYLRQAWKARGSKYVRDTPEINFINMRNLAEKARADFEEAARRSPRLIVAYASLIQLAQLTSDDRLLSEAAEKALALDPADQWIYDRWLDALAPQWGGTGADRQRIIDRGLQHADENPLLKRLAARPACMEAEVAEFCRSCKTQQNARVALDAYRRAAAVGPIACVIDGAADAAERAGDSEAVVRFSSQSYRFSRRFEPLYRRALTLQSLGKPELALESVDNVLNQQPNNVEALNYKGWVYEEQHKASDAESEFHAAAQIDPDNREANTELVNLYLGALRKPDEAKKIVDRLMSENPNNPRAWLLSAVLDHGKDEQHCKLALGKYLQLVDKADPDSYEQRDIDRATKRLAELTRKDPLSNLH
jgi:tetratricopeptide (TPR) repeat protein